MGIPVRLEINALLLWSAISIPVILKDNCNYIFYGDENITTRPFRYRNQIHFDYSWNQSQEATNLINDYYSNIFENLKIGSFLRPLNTITIQRTLCERYPELYKIQMSCNSAYPKDGTFVHCNGCDKCHRTYLILKALGYDPSEISLIEEKILKKRFSLLQLIRSYGICPTAPEELFYVLSKTNYYPDITFPNCDSMKVESLNFSKDRADASFLDKELFDKIYPKVSWNDVLYNGKPVPLDTVYDRLKKDNYKPTYKM